MPLMKKQHITQLENQLEQLIEGGFARLFGRSIQAQDIAIKLTRAMEDHLAPATGSDPRLIAPDTYMIFTHPHTQNQLLDKYPELTSTLSSHMTELATQIGYRLNHPPQIKILADHTLATNALTITASHQDHLSSSTAAMQRAEIPIEIPTMPKNPQMVIDQDRIVSLELGIINVGRHPDNQIILEDTFVSRHHIQLRLRHGSYMLFDVGSQSGTFVNGQRTMQHQLRSSDVIRIGKTQMLYLEEADFAEYIQQTDSIDPLL